MLRLLALLGVVSGWSVRAATFLVTTNSDDGPGSLRQTLNTANSLAPGATIAFDLPAKFQSIFLLSPLPPLTNSMTIDGSTQPGFAGKPLITLNGANAGPNANGLVILSSGNLIRSLVINDFSLDGILVQGGGANVFQGNALGTDANGTNASVPNMGSGLDIQSSPANLIGGLLPGQGNLLSGNADAGLILAGEGCAGNLVVGNFVGTRANGLGAMENGLVGVFVIDASGNTIGGTNAASRNIVSGNNGDGIEIFAADSTNNVVQGNYCGLDATGERVVANQETGIYIEGGYQNLIGGEAPGAGNLVTGNLEAGITVSGIQGFGNGFGNVIQGNWVGLDASGTNAIGNTLDGISIFGAPGVLVGGTNPAARNIVCASTLSGIYLNGSATLLTTIYGNHIGVGPDGVTPMGNLAHGVELDNDASLSVVGGTAPGQANIIAYARTPLYAGVRVHSGSNNAIRGNSIFLNAGLGIDLGDNGPNTNTLQNLPDAEGGQWQNYPVLKSVVVDHQTRAQGILNSHPLSSYLVDFYSNTETNPTGRAQGRVWLGDCEVRTDAKGDGVFSAAFPRIGPGAYITATATRQNRDTSEFSPAFTALLQSELEATEQAAASGLDLLFTISIVNHAAVPATNLAVTVQTPANTTLVSALLNGTVAGVASGNTVTFHLASLAGNGQASILVTALPKSAAAAVCSVTLQPGGPDADTYSHSASAALQVPVNVTLAASLAAGGLTLRWTGSTGEFNAEQTSSLVPPVTWLPVAAVPAFSGSNATLSLPPPGPGLHFYRLAAP